MEQQDILGTQGGGAAGAPGREVLRPATSASIRDAELTHVNEQGRARMVDVGAKQYAYIKLSELSDDPNVKPEDVVKVGDEIETYIVRVNDGTTQGRRPRRGAGGRHHGGQAHLGARADVPPGAALGRGHWLCL